MKNNAGQPCDFFHVFYRQLYNSYINAVLGYVNEPDARANQIQWFQGNRNRKRHIDHGDIINGIIWAWNEMGKFKTFSGHIFLFRFLEASRLEHDYNIFADDVARRLSGGKKVLMWMLCMYICTRFVLQSTLYCLFLLYGLRFVMSPFPFP